MVRGRRPGDKDTIQLDERSYHSSHRITDTVGSRIREARLRKEMTQEALGRLVGIGRSGVAQWERNDAIPPLTTLETIAQVLETPVEKLSFGITNEPKIVPPDPVALGYFLVPEVTFGEKPDDRIEANRWGLPISYLKAEMGISDFASAFIYDVPVTLRESRFELSDRLIVDGAATRPSPPGTFLFWDGVGPAFGDMVVIPNPSTRKHIVKVTTPHGAFEQEAERMVILGRIKGRLARL